MTGFKTKKQRYEDTKPKICSSDAILKMLGCLPKKKKYISIRCSFDNIVRLVHLKELLHFSASGSISFKKAPTTKNKC